MSAWRPTACALPRWRHPYRFRQSFPTRLSPCTDAAAASRQPYEATDMLADFELVGGRSTALTQPASPRFEENEALSARQMGMGNSLRPFRQPLIVFCYQVHLVLSIWMRHCLGGTASFLSPLTPKGLIPHRLVDHLDLLNFHWSSVNPSPLDRLSRW